MATEEQYGELIPKGGGDPIPLIKTSLMIGRRESCDVILRFGNVSAHHCEMTLEGGYWFIKDLNSRNGTRVNGCCVTKRRVDPNDVISVAKLRYELKYVPAELGAVGPPPDGGELEDILGSSLMESAGLNRKTRQVADGRIGRDQPPPASVQSTKPPEPVNAADDKAEASPDSKEPTPTDD